MASAGIGHSVEGIHPVTAALQAGRVRRLTVEAGRSKRSPLAEIVERAHTAGIDVRTVDDVLTQATTAVPQGVIAHCTPVALVDVDDLAAVERPAIVILDHVEDPHNVGAIARSAAAAGMTGMLVADVRAAPLEASAFKASAGALERLPVAAVSSIAQAVKRLASHGVWSVGLDASGDESLFDLGLLTEPVAVVVGAEGRGLSELVARRCDVLVRIPMPGALESLNASVAAALACFEVARRRRA